ncbi:hypothetical protein [Prolixibacter sp. SD074]|jgi:hypothetical protein|uniref:hypothetical protein n=1 Tax=Prolixibacter sp. SD074 TaxID=2652391 RepID=UPI0012720022|nr:hypothetical protein [Prolixibacter sp. SD074]GET28486.1 hypothetical protein SD074_06880 [Prolixibacter sp. SD074]
MMRIKNLLVVTAALLTLIMFSSFAPGRQDGFRELFRRSPETRAQVVTMVMENRLDMDEAQAEKALQINLKYAKLSQSYLKVEGVTMENTGELLALNQKRSDELKAILTPEQIKKAEDIREKWINRLETILVHLKENNF